jgi:hypothetical protein
MSNNTRWEPRTWDGSSRPHIVAKREKRSGGAAWFSMLVSATGLACVLGWGVATATNHINQALNIHQEIGK